MFTVEEFVETCRNALDEHTPELAIKEIVTSAMAEPHELESAFGTPSEAGMATLHRSPELTILNIIWPPGIALYPHDHNLWAVIGLYGGQEDNTFYTRNLAGDGLVRTGTRVLESKETVLLAQDAIHAVQNPRSVYTGAIHVYGGDFFNEPRSQWASDRSAEEPYNVEQVQRVFKFANEQWLSKQVS